MNVSLVTTNVTEMPIASTAVIKFIVNVKLDMMVMVISAVTSMNVAKELTIVTPTQNVLTPSGHTIVNVIMGISQCQLILLKIVSQTVWQLQVKL